MRYFRGFASENDLFHVKHHFVIPAKAGIS